jgi:hypothetical protein
MQWFCTIKQPKIINPVALEKKRQRILAATADQHKPNPYIGEYRAALVELLAEQTKSQDEFINWIGGLSTASMYLAFTGIESAPQNMKFVLLLSGLVSFAGVITAIAFKYFSAVRFSGLRLETTILANLARGHDINTSIENFAKQWSQAIGQIGRVFRWNFCRWRVIHGTTRAGALSARCFRPRG